MGIDGREAVLGVTRRGALVVAMALAAACADEPDDGRVEAPADPRSTLVAPPARIRDGTWDEALAAGQSVTVEGRFLGNDPESVCAFASTSRSRPRTGLDWAIRKDGRCMWVEAGQSIFGNPQAILDKASVGRAVEITATVRRDDTGRLYLEYVAGDASD